MFAAITSIFRLTNRRGYFAPHLDVEYREKDSDVRWRLICGGTRLYAVRFVAGNIEKIDDETADSHFMARRITTSLLFGGFGLFQVECVGRIVFTNLTDYSHFWTHLDTPDPLDRTQPPQHLVARTYDWFNAICDHTVLRRACDDAHLALRDPHEAGIYVYRGLEWIVMGTGISWDDLAKDIGVQVSDVRAFKKMANVDLGVRHATRSGLKLRADSENYATWVCSLFDAIQGARSRLDSGFTPMPPEEVAQAVMRAAPIVSFD